MMLMSDQPCSAIPRMGCNAAMPKLIRGTRNPVFAMVRCREKASKCDLRSQSRTHTSEDVPATVVGWALRATRLTAVRNHVIMRGGSASQLWLDTIPPIKRPCTTSRPPMRNLNGGSWPSVSRQDGEGTQAGRRLGQSGGTQTGLELVRIPRLFGARHGSDSKRIALTRCKRTRPEQ
jgi:hypothetical protein